jgi:hypothetical protein
LAIALSRSELSGRNLFEEREPWKRKELLLRPDVSSTKWTIPWICKTAQKGDGNRQGEVETIVMETPNSAFEAPANIANVPLSQVLAIALLCGSLTFGCLFTSFRGKPQADPRAASAPTLTQTGFQSPALADSSEANRR